jgi:hypothetical protein
MSLVGLIGILLGLLAWPFACVQRTPVRVGVFALLFLAHVASAVVYYQYVQTSSADTAMYYNDPFDQYGTGFGVNTLFIIYVVQFLKTTFGGTYLDYFFVFQAFGFFGIALLMRSIEEIYASLDIEQPLWSYLLLFLPGIHFWTSSIGKDSLLFTASCLALWATMHVRRRYIQLALAIGLMILVRPHIALIAVAAAAWTVLGDRTTNLFLRTLLFLVSLGGLIVAAATMRSTFALDVTSADSISDFLAVRENVMASSTSDDLGNSAVLNAPYPVKVLSFLFRPLFIDAEGAFGYIASLENVLFLSITGMVMLRFRTVIAAVKVAPFIRYALIFSVGVTLALSIHYYNIGLGLRQKTMVVPGFLMIFVALAAIRQAQHRAAEIAQPMRARLEAA